jgi:ABC-type transport system involved in multi-copper enzyme maturation permease subunit
MSRVWAIARNTFREAVRNRILYSLLFFAVLFIGGSSLLSQLTVGEYEKVIIDMGLAAISVFGVLIAIFVGIGLVNREIERKTIYTLASKPVSRAAIVVGKYLGLVMVLALLVALMGVAFGVTLVLNGISLQPDLATALVLGLVELMVVTAFAVLYSTFSGPTVASFFCLSTYVIGHLVSDIRDFGAAADGFFVRELSAALYWVLPNLDNFNVRTEVVHGVPLAMGHLAATVGYGLIYSAVVVGVGTVVFRYRDF